MVRNYRKPLIVHWAEGTAATSSCRVKPAGDGFRYRLQAGAERPVCDNRHRRPEGQGVLFSFCGKYYYTLDGERKSRGVDNMAIVRVEVSREEGFSTFMAECPLCHVKSKKKLNDLRGKEAVRTYSNPRLCTIHH